MIVKYGWGGRYHMVLVEQKMGLSCPEEVLSSSWEAGGTEHPPPSPLAGGRWLVGKAPTTGSCQGLSQLCPFAV